MRLIIVIIPLHKHIPRVTSFRDGSSFGEDQWGCRSWVPAHVYKGTVLDFNAEAMTWQVDFQLVKSCQCRRILVGQTTGVTSRGSTESVDEYEFEFDTDISAELNDLTHGQTEPKKLKQVGKKRACCPSRISESVNGAGPEYHPASASLECAPSALGKIRRVVCVLEIGERGDIWQGPQNAGHAANYCRQAAGTGQLSEMKRLCIQLSYAPAGARRSRSGSRV